MADSFFGVADTLKFNDADLDVGIIQDLLADAPLVARMFARSVKSNTYKYLKKTANPSVGFRAENDGRENAKGTYSNVTVALKIMDASFAMDVAVAESDERGVEAALAAQAVDHLQAAFFDVESQILYGTDADSGGSAGLADQTNLDGLSDAQVVNAGGTTANTGSSCWLIRNGLSDCHLVWGQNGEISVGERTIQRIAGATTGTFPAYYIPITAWFGLQIGATRSVVRIANITADSGKGLTDALIASAISKFPAQRGPNLCVMSRRSLAQLQQSRTATNPTGAPAPFPESSHGVPIVVTDAQLDTEALLT